MRQRRAEVWLPWHREVAARRHAAGMEGEGAAEAEPTQQAKPRHTASRSTVTQEEEEVMVSILVVVSCTSYCRGLQRVYDLRQHNRMQQHETNGSSIAIACDLGEKRTATWAFASTLFVENVSILTHCFSLPPPNATTHLASVPPNETHTAC